MNKTPEEILSKYEDDNEYHFHNVDKKWIVEAMQEYGKQQYNQAIKDAAENAKVKSVKTEIGNKTIGIPTSRTMQVNFIVDKDSILKLLKS